MDTSAAWIGRHEERGDTLRAWPVDALDAALGQATRLHDVLPPLRHWLYFHAPVARTDTDADGHRKRGGFFPDVALPRRMWAASEIVFERPLPLESQVLRHSSIAAVERKVGRSGDLVFVDVEHRIDVRDGAHAAIRETQRIVYRDDTAAAVPPPPPSETCGDWEASVVADEILLFRYSALTANAHRIHYDLRYAREVEHYPDLVVQGPLQATLLVDAWQVRHPHAVLRRFSFRALAPSFVGDTLTLAGRRTGDCDAELWLRRGDGSVGIRASVTFA